jgi:YaiO family outer membrane protein
MMRSISNIFTTVLFLLYAMGASAQDWKALTVDEIFQQAREKAFNGKREEAREMLLFILEKSPDYSDVRILLGRTYAWDGQRDKARTELQKVLEKNPVYEDGLNARIDVEMWDDQYERALEFANIALKTYPNSEDFLYKRASCLNNLNRQDDALITLNQLLAVSPSNEKGLSLLSSIKTGRLKYTAGISYSIDIFSRTFDPAHYTSVQLARANRWGSSIVRFNYANRFNTQGFQPEVDLYPKIADGVYAYVNYGFSSTDLFPQHRVGGELYTRLPKSFEASAGVRYLYFGKSSDVTIFTGSLGKYFKSYWISIRPYVTPSRVTGTSFSTSVNLRKYFENRDQYIGINVGLGFSPDERRFQTGSGFTSDGIYVLKSQRIGIGWSKQLKRNIIILANADFARQEVIFDKGNYIIITTFGVGLRKRF